jgi:hypothetical protein
MKGMVESIYARKVVVVAATLLAFPYANHAQSPAHADAFLKALQLDKMCEVSSVTYRSTLQRLMPLNSDHPSLHFDFNTVEHSDGRFFSEYHRIENGVKTDSSSTACWDGNSFSELQHKGGLLRFGSNMPRDINPFNLSGWIALPYKPLLYLSGSSRRFLLLGDLTAIQKLMLARIQKEAKTPSIDARNGVDVWLATLNKGERQFRVWTQANSEHSVPIIRWEEYVSGLVVARCEVLESNSVEYASQRYAYASAVKLQYFSFDRKSNSREESTLDSEWKLTVRDVSINQAQDDDFLIDPSSANEVYSLDEGVLVTVPH